MHSYLLHTDVDLPLAPAPIFAPPIPFVARPHVPNWPAIEQIRTEKAEIAATLLASDDPKQQAFGAKHAHVVAMIDETLRSRNDHAAVSSSIK